eukprot:UN12309
MGVIGSKPRLTRAATAVHPDSLLRRHRWDAGRTKRGPPEGAPAMSPATAGASPPPIRGLFFASSDAGPPTILFTSCLRLPLTPRWSPVAHAGASRVSTLESFCGCCPEIGRHR